jgi:hypothetical protein
MRYVPWVVGFLWVCLIGTGCVLLLRYKAVAGDAGTPPQVWPSTSELRRAIEEHTLLLFVHPRCPCTSATLEELTFVLTRGAGQVRAQVLFAWPNGQANAWTETKLVRAVQRLPGVQAIWDEGGRETSRFGIRTSGHALLYDTAGQLCFSGGLTPARGHGGDCAGSAALLARLRGDSAARATAPVFGCPLFDAGFLPDREAEACGDDF